MRKKDELLRGCVAKAREDEMIFALLGRDVSAPAAIRAWIADRIARGLNAPGDAQIVEAWSCAEQMSRDHATTQLKNDKEAERLRLRAQVVDAVDPKFIVSPFVGRDELLKDDDRPAYTPANEYEPDPPTMGEIRSPSPSRGRPAVDSVQCHRCGGRVKAYVDLEGVSRYALHTCGAFPCSQNGQVIPVTTYVAAMDAPNPAPSSPVESSATIAALKGVAADPRPLTPEDAAQGAALDADLQSIRENPVAKYATCPACAQTIEVATLANGTRILIHHAWSPVLSGSNYQCSMSGHAARVDAVDDRNVQIKGHPFEEGKAT